jgi:hypothetical protein
MGSASGLDVTERTIYRDVIGQTRRMLADPIAPATAPDRLDALDRCLRRIERRVGAELNGDVSLELELRNLAALALAWLSALEGRR